MTERNYENTAGNEDVLDEVADLEEYSQKGEKPPLCRGYRIRVNGDHFIVHKAQISGKEVLELAELVPPETYTLRVKKAGQRPAKVELDEVVDLRTPGIEKFKALPKDQTEGS